MTSDSSVAAATATAAATTAGGGRTVPWSQVVRGGTEPEPVSTSSVLPEQNLVVSDQSTAMELPPNPAKTKTDAAEEEEAVLVVESQSDGNASGVMKSAWNKQPLSSLVPNGGVVIGGAASWPALSESLSKSSESYGSSSVSVSQAPVVTQPPQKPVKSNASHHNNQNHARPAWQKSIKKGGGGGAAGGGYNQPPPSLPPPPPPMPPYPVFDMSYGGFLPAVLDSGVREQSPYNGSGFVPRPMASVGSHSRPHDQSSNRKRNNFGPRPRGEGGSYVNNNGHGGRRDQHDRDWRGPRSHVVMPHQGAPPPPPPPRGYVPQPHLGPAPFIAPQPIRPFGAPMGYEMPPPFVYVPAMPPESYRGAPVLPRAPPPPPMYIPVMEPPLSVLIQHQIEYYFSDANLVKDNYLRSNMDEKGWVPVSLIAGFRRVQNLTCDIQMILSCLRDSAVVEVQGETVRRRNDWAKWVQPSPNTNIPADSSSQSPHAAPDGSAIETSIQKLVLDESTSVQENTIDTNDSRSKEEALDTYSSGFTNSLKLANGEVTNGDQSINAKPSTAS